MLPLEATVAALHGQNVPHIIKAGMLLAACQRRWALEVPPSYVAVMARHAGIAARIALLLEQERKS